MPTEAGRIARIAKMLPRLIGEEIDVTFTRGEGWGSVRVDLLQIEQILMNLAANARDAMLLGGHLKIETSHQQLDEAHIHFKRAIIPAGRYALITVTDDGAGIAPEHLPHIFEPFHSTRRWERAPG